MRNATGRDRGAPLVDLARYLAQNLVPGGELRLVHIWTPEVDFLFFKRSRRARRILREQDLSALETVLVKVGEALGRDVVVDFK
ncbi:MAG TPA: hypothetical protein ENF77_02410 [Candidatus Acetothermia bacterium]|nr:hypothetical protein [Candidatus Acetothermia bacterium]